MVTNLTFNYAAMNSGKSTSLIQLAYNYESIGCVTAIYNYKSNKIETRIGLNYECDSYDEDTRFFESMDGSLVNVVLVDEAQFLIERQVAELCCVVDFLNIPVWCYGLRTDAFGKPFEGSKFLLALADDLVEIPCIDTGGEQAIMQVRLDALGNRVYGGPQIQIGHNYKSVSRKNFRLDKIYNIRRSS